MINLTGRQWGYICARLNLLGDELLEHLNITHSYVLGYRLKRLNILCKRRLRCSIADLIVESESVYTISEIAAIAGIDRNLVRYRIKTCHIPTVTKYPTIHILQQDLWSVLKQPNLARLLKSNPLFNYRYSNRISINLLSQRLKCTEPTLIRLEYGSLYPSPELSTALEQLQPQLSIKMKIWHHIYWNTKL